NVELLKALAKSPYLELGKMIGGNSRTAFEEALVDNKTNFVEALIELNAQKKIKFLKPVAINLNEVIVQMFEPDSFNKEIDVQIWEKAINVLDLNKSIVIQDSKSSDNKKETTVLMAFVAKIADVDEQIERYEGMLAAYKAKNNSIARKIQNVAADAVASALGGNKEQLDVANNIRRLEGGIEQLRKKKSEFEQVFDILVDKGNADLLAKNKQNECLLTMLAIKAKGKLGGKELDQIKKILGLSGVDQAYLVEEDAQGRKPIINLIALGDEEICKQVLAKLKTDVENALLQGETNAGFTPVMAAAISGNIGVFNQVKAKLSDNDVVKAEHKEAFYKTPDKLGNTLLHYAVEGKNQQIIEDILSVRGVDIDAQNIYGLTPLAKAVVEGNLEAVKALMMGGANINIPDKQGNTPLMYAAQFNRKEILIELLKDPRIDVNAANKVGITAYMLAAINSGKDKPPISTNTEGGNAALSVDTGAAWEGDKAILKLLIARGAIPIFGKSYESISGAFAENLIKAQMLAAASDCASKALKTAGSLTPPGMGGEALSILGGVFEWGRRAIGLNAAWTAYKDTKEKFNAQFLQWIGVGTAITLDKNSDLMIGAFKYNSGWFGIRTVVHGNELKSEMASQSVFDGDKKGLIFSFSNDEIAFGSVNNQAENYHKTLVARYFAVENELKKPSLWWWQRQALEKLMDDIKNADNSLLANNAKAFVVAAGSYKHLLDMMKGEEKERFANEIIAKKHPEVEQIIKLIMDGDAIVPIDVIKQVYEFEELKKQVKKKDGPHDSVTKLEINVAELFEEFEGKADNIKTQRHAREAAMKKGQDAQSKSGYILGAIDLLSQATGTDTTANAKDVAQGLSVAAGAVSAGITQALVDPEGMKSNIQTVQSALTAGGTVFSVMQAVGATAVGVACSPLGAVVGVGALGYAAYQNKSNIAAAAASVVNVVVNNAAQVVGQAAGAVAVAIGGGGDVVDMEATLGGIAIQVNEKVGASGLTVDTHDSEEEEEDLDVASEIHENNTPEVNVKPRNVVHVVPVPVKKKESIINLLLSKIGLGKKNNPEASTAHPNATPPYTAGNTAEVVGDIDLTQKQQHERE
ncbi:MAG: ankyrin repeat domain-containing protein, partial [Rickettsiales bacterium]